MDGDERFRNSSSLFEQDLDQNVNFSAQCSFNFSTNTFGTPIGVTKTPHSSTPIDFGSKYSFNCEGDDFNDSELNNPSTSTTNEEVVAKSKETCLSDSLQQALFQSLDQEKEQEGACAKAQGYSKFLKCPRGFQPVPPTTGKGKTNKGGKGLKGVKSKKVETNIAAAARTSTRRSNRKTQNPYCKSAFQYDLSD